MMIFDRYAGSPVWSQFCICSIRLVSWLSLYWVNVFAIMILLVAALLSLLAFIDSASIQFAEEQRSISSALFFSDCTMNRSAMNGSAPPFYGYHLALLYNFGCRIAQQAM